MRRGGRPARPAEGIAAPGRVDAVAGSCSRSRTTAYQDAVLPAGRAHARPSRPASPSAGTAGPTTPSASTASARRRRARWPWRSSASTPDNVGRPRPATCSPDSRGDPDDHDCSSSTTSRARAPGSTTSRRGWITERRARRRWVDRGVRGITSNPTIFQKAIGDGRRLRRAVRRARRRRRRSTTPTGSSSPRTSRTRSRILRPGLRRAATASTASSRSRSRPALARDTDGTIAAARAPARAHRRAEPLREDPRHGRGRPGHPADDRRGPQHQRHPDLLASSATAR